jgi:hypothetical protein
VTWRSFRRIGGLFLHGNETKNLIARSREARAKIFAQTAACRPRLHGETEILPPHWRCRYSLEPIRHDAALQISVPPPRSLAGGSHRCKVG